jgi:hypothetical protein
MDCRPNQDEAILEALEVYRQGGQEMSDPRLAFLAERLAADPQLADRFQHIQRADALLAAAMQDVPPPPGLAQRLLERLAAARNEAPVGGMAAAHASLPEAESPLVHADAPIPAARRVLGQRSRRWLVGALVTAPLAAAVLAAILFGWREPQRFTPSLVLQEARDWFQNESQESADWRVEAPPADFPFSRDVQPAPQPRWQPIAGLASHGVAYDLAGPGEPRTVLYVVRQTVAGLPSEPPLEPAATTGGCSIAAWQAGDLVYVLVVEGSPRSYRNYLRLSSGPLT